ncbi:MAG: hypothetical protein HW384_304 [Dehalococcoidia bacterium]|nr:hypothetical protein [Dehalococcoidia bacterium]
MILVKSKNGVPIRLTQERWGHIARRHPEMENQREKVLETLSAPDMVQQGDLDTLIAVKLYTETPLSEKYLIAVYRETSEADGFVLTAYFTNTPSERRKVLWKR